MQAVCERDAGKVRLCEPASGGRFICVRHMLIVAAAKITTDGPFLKDARGGCDLTQCGMKCKWRLLDERLCRKKYSHHKCAPQLSVTVL
jgi:hypothetical protein